MNRAGLFPVFILLALIPAYIFTLTTIALLQKQLPTGDNLAVTLPAPVLKITSLEYDGLVSDLFYLRALVLFGSTFDGKQRRLVAARDYDSIKNLLVTSTDLDPYFLDPYFLANAVLTWDADRVKEANQLLAKGSRYREWDYWLPFYLGFNSYYFLGDHAKAAQYLMIASKKPGADPFFSFFAARLAYMGNSLENAIVFLEGILKTTTDKLLRQDYETRLAALKIMLDLEKRVALYRQQYGTYPANLKVLVAHQLLDRIPVDPYGGEFYLHTDGKIKTSSDLRPVTKKDH